MTWVAVAVAGGSLVAGGLNYLGTKKSSQAAQAGSDAAIAEQQRQYDLTRSDLAPYRAIGTQALNALGSIYGYQPAQNYFASSAPTGTPYQASYGLPTITSTTAGRDFTHALNPGGNLLIDSLGINRNSTAGKILDPLGGLFGGLFGGGHSSKERNAKAFLQAFPVQDLGNGMLALPDGTVFPQSQFNDLAGTWYGATFAPDGNQSGWQQKYNDVLSSIQALPQNANRQQTGLTSDGVPQMAQVGPGGASQTSQPLTSPNYSNFFASPDYQFRRSEGIRGIENTFSASGGAKSGNALRALADYNSNLAAGEFGNYFNRQAALAGIGQTATNATTQAGLTTAANVGNALQSAANSRASGIQGQYNALGNTLGDLGYLAGNYFANRRPVGNYYGGGFGPTGVYGG